jgi:hypothetical protein
VKLIVEDVEALPTDSLTLARAPVKGANLAGIIPRLINRNAKRSRDRVRNRFHIGNRRWSLRAIS